MITWPASCDQSQGEGELTKQKSLLRRVAASSQTLKNSIDVSAYLTGNRTVLLFEGVDEDSARRVCTELLALNAKDPKKDITLLINSPGGGVVAGNAILEVMDMIDCDVRTVAVGQAASMGATIFAHGTKGKREIGPKARVLLHQIRTGTGFERMSDVEIGVEESKRLAHQLAQSIANDCGRPVEHVEADFKEDLWLNCDQAIEYGVADKILALSPGKQSAKAPENPRAREILAQRRMQTRGPGLTLVA